MSRLQFMWPDQLVLFIYIIQVKLSSLFPPGYELWAIILYKSFNWTRKIWNQININEFELILNDSDWTWFQLSQSVFHWSILLFLGLVTYYYYYGFLVPVILKIWFQIQLFTTATRPSTRMLFETDQNLDIYSMRLFIRIQYIFQSCHLLLSLFVCFKITTVSLVTVILMVA